MQIHELTQKKKLDEAWGEDPITDLGQAAGKAVSGVKNIGSAIASPFKDVAGGYKDARMDQKVSAVADKAYRAWKSYESQLLTTNPTARTDGQYEQALLAFVNKNLLGGMYLPNVINKDKITALVKQISGTPAQQPTATKKPPAQQPTATKKPLTKQPAANAAGAGVFGQMANQLGGPTIHEAIAPIATTPAQPAPPAPPAPVAAAAPANDKDLFKQLVQQTSLAQTAAPGTGGGDMASGPNAKTKNKNAQGGNQDAQGMSQTLAQQLDPAIVKSLPVLSAKAAKLTGTNQVKSTGNPGADGLLVLMGFQGL